LGDLLLLVWSFSKRKIGANQLRLAPVAAPLHLANIALKEPGTFTMQVVDGAGRVVEDLTKAELAGKSDLWTKTAFGDFIGVRLYGDAAPQSISFDINKLSFDFAPIKSESIVGPDQRKQVVDYVGAYSDVIAKIERPVAKVTFIRDGAGYACTGFLIGEDRLLTNDHCVDTDPICQTTVVLFGYQYQIDGALSTGEQYRCSKVLASNVSLDFAMLQLEGSPGNIWGVEKLSATDPQKGDQLLMVEHPAGEPKQVSVADCKSVTGAVQGRGAEPDTDIGDSCDTLGGSSGSPVFNTSGAVILLHHLGKAQSGSFSDMNRAVRMVKIMEVLQP
jgi:V8-like Glu-specific endopeptidase